MTLPLLFLLATAVNVDDGDVEALKARAEQAAQQERYCDSLHAYLALNDAAPASKWQYNAAEVARAAHDRRRALDLYMAIEARDPTFERIDAVHEKRAALQKSIEAEGAGTPCVFELPTAAEATAPPDAPDAPDATKPTTEPKTKTEPKAAPSATPATASARADMREQPGRGALFWSLVGGGAVVGLGGIVFDLASPTTYDSELDGYDAIGPTLMGVGATSAIVGFVVNRNHGEEDEATP